VKLIEAHILIAESNWGEAKRILKDLISESNDINLEACSLYSELLLSEGILDEAFLNLNQVLKYDYKNSVYWQQLGRYYTLKEGLSESASDK